MEKYMMDAREAWIYTQCTDKEGNKGSFLGDENKNSISPVFDNLIQLYIWLDASRFEPIPGSYTLCRIKEKYK